MAAAEHMHSEPDIDEEAGITFHELSDEEFRTMFEERAREWLGMSGDDFIEKVNAGETGDLDHSSVVMLEMMIPFLGR